MNIRSRFFRRGGDRGQSLVETALFLPILIIIIAGVVEVSNLLVTQNKILTASRMAAGFGAANYVRNDWTAADGTADAMGDVALNTVTQTLELSPDLWDVYSIRALTSAAGDDFAEFESKHAYGNNSVVPAAEWSAIEATIKSEMLSDLQSTGTISGNVEVVASVPFHNIDDILGIPVWQWTGYSRLQGMTVMRVFPEANTTACPILPIAVRLEQFSIYPSNWQSGVSRTGIAGDPVALFPVGTGPDGWDYPTDPTPPIYLNAALDEPELFVTGASTEFGRNDPGVPLRTAMEEDYANPNPGNLYWSRDVGEGGNFGWLSWAGSTDANTLADSLEPPGNFYDQYPGGESDENRTGDPPENIEGCEPDGGTEATGDCDGTIEAGEWADNGPGNMNKKEVREWLEGYVDRRDHVNILVFDKQSSELPGVSGQGENVMYQAYDFITVRLVGYSFGSPASKGSKWILFEFVSSCLKCSSSAVNPYP
jgi:hypothetical protein